MECVGAKNIDNIDNSAKFIFTVIAYNTSTNSQLIIHVDSLR